MKTIRMLLAIALLLGAATIYTQAESRIRWGLCRFPFGFSVQSRGFPAGGYTVSDSFDQAETAIQLRSSDGKRFAVIHTHPTYSLHTSAMSELIFQR